jgi:hypothetical protein
VVVAHEDASEADSYYALDAIAMPPAAVLPEENVVLDASVPIGFTTPVVAAPGTELQFVGVWTAAEPVVAGDRLFHRLSSDSGEVLIATETPWMNPLDRFDVDLNGTVTPRDALLLINRLASIRGGGPLTLQDRHHADLHRYFDVTGDAALTPRDAIVVINRLAGVGPAASTAIAGETARTGGDWAAGMVDEAVASLF